MKSEGELTLVFTDLEGSSALCERLGAAFEPWRDQHFALLREALQQSGGEEIETAGDSLFAAFDSSSDAARFAVRAQLAFARFVWPDETGALKVRIGAQGGDRKHRCGGRQRMGVAGRASP